MTSLRRNIKASKLKKLITVNWSDFDKTTTDLNRLDQIKSSARSKKNVRR